MCVVCMCAQLRVVSSHFSLVGKGHQMVGRNGITELKERGVKSSHGQRRKAFRIGSCGETSSRQELFHSKHYNADNGQQGPVAREPKRCNQINWQSGFWLGAFSRICVSFNVTPITERCTWQTYFECISAQSLREGGGNVVSRLCNTSDVILV